MKCNSCKINAEIKASKELACCKWYMDNVICGNKTDNDCDAYIKQEENNGD